MSSRFSEKTDTENRTELVSKAFKLIEKYLNILTSFSLGVLPEYNTYLNTAKTKYIILTTIKVI